MNQLVAFRCQDGTYLLVPNAASTPWLEHQGVEFIGETDLRSFATHVATRVERQIAKWNVARVTKDDYYFAWSKVVPVTPAASPASSLPQPTRLPLSLGSSGRS